MACGAPDEAAGGVLEGFGAGDVACEGGVDGDGCGGVFDEFGHCYAELAAVVVAAVIVAVGVGGVDDEGGAVVELAVGEIDVGTGLLAVVDDDFGDEGELGAVGVGGNDVVGVDFFVAVEVLREVGAFGAYGEVADAEGVGLAFVIVEEGAEFDVVAVGFDAPLEDGDVGLAVVALPGGCADGDAYGAVEGGAAFGAAVATVVIAAVVAAIVANAFEVECYGGLDSGPWDVLGGDGHLVGGDVVDLEWHVAVGEVDFDGGAVDGVVGVVVVTACCYGAATVGLEGDGCVEVVLAGVDAGAAEGHAVNLP